MPAKQQSVQLSISLAGDALPVLLKWSDRRKTIQISIDRQQNILSRMLEAEKAMEERDEEEKREGTTGEQIPPQIPPNLTLEELEKEIRSRLNDPNFTKYSPDYQRLIEKYFELLKKINPSDIQ